MEIRLFYTGCRPVARWRAAVLQEAAGPVLFKTRQYGDFTKAIDVAREWMRENYPERDCRCVLMGPDPGPVARDPGPQEPTGKEADHA